MTRRQFFAAIPAAVLAWFGWRSKPKLGFVRVVRDGETFLRFPAPAWVHPIEAVLARGRAKARLLGYHVPEPADSPYDFSGADKFWSVHTKEQP